MASPGRQAGPCCRPVLQVQRGSGPIRPPVLLLLFVSDQGVTYARARKQSNLKEKRRSTHGPNTHSCPVLTRLGILEGRPAWGSVKSPPEPPVASEGHSRAGPEGPGRREPVQRPCLWGLWIKAPLPARVRGGRGRTAEARLSATDASGPLDHLGINSVLPPLHTDRVRPS